MQCAGTISRIRPPTLVNTQGGGGGRDVGGGKTGDGGGGGRGGGGVQGGGGVGGDNERGKCGSIAHPC